MKVVVLEPVELDEMLRRAAELAVSKLRDDLERTRTPELMDARQLAVYLNCNRSTINSYVKRGMPEERCDACEGNLEMDAGAGASDYSHSLTFTSSKFIVTAFGHDREHCEDVLQCVLRGRFADHEGDKEFGRL